MLNFIKKIFNSSQSTLEVDFRKQGNEFLVAGNMLQAENCFRRFVDAQPGNPEAYINLAFVLIQTGQETQAKAHLLKALTLNPIEKHDIFYLLGVACQKQQALSDACDYFNQALIEKSNFSEAYYNLANVTNLLGFHQEAIDILQKGAELTNGNVYLGNEDALLYLKSTNTYYSNSQYLKEAKKYADYLQRGVMAYTSWKSLLKIKKLKVGLVSGDLCNHPVGFFINSFISYLDKQSIEIVVYATSEQADELTQTIQSSCASWSSIVNLTDHEAAQRIYQDQVDILIDLSGYTEHSRLGLFAWKPAPLQITWLGYWASTGLSTIDYVLADKISLPEQYQDQFVEKVWYLPNTRMCFGQPVSPILVSVLPACHNGFVTFASFQSLAKISDRVLLLWSRVLKAVPNSRLRLQARQLVDEGVQRIFKKRLQKADISLDRVEMSGSASHMNYLTAHAAVDIILDTFPFTGGTTTCEALWMGVPTLTLLGDTLIGRQGASMLTCAGLPHWVAQSEEEFIDLAVKYASALDDLAALRAQLRQQVLASPLFDGAAFARHWENALHEMWREKITMLTAEQ